MALKMDRQVNATEIGYFLNEVAERGVMLSVKTQGSGVALDSPINEATVAAAASGQAPLGILMNDFVDIDRTRLAVNHMKDQHVVGDKCTALTDGWIVTDKVLGDVDSGQLAVLAESGNLRAVDVGTASTDTAPVVGRFRSRKSEEGFARVQINL